MDEVSSTNNHDVTLAAPLFPPCCVCGEKASGYHYGANTCEACKTFFRRAENRTTPYKCRLAGNCKILPGKRDCSKCRLDKCLKAGMSKAAIKNGRHTLEQRAHIINEVKRLEIQNRMTSAGQLNTGADQREREMNEMVQQLARCTLDPGLNNHPNTAFQSVLRHQMDKIISESTFGSLKRVPRDDYLRVKQMTGLDVDSRKQLLHRLMFLSARMIDHFLRFAQFIPGFNKLLPYDQKALLLGGRLEVWLVMFSCQYNTDLGLMTYPIDPDFIIEYEDMKGFTNNMSDLHKLWDMVARIQRLDLTSEEAAVAGAMALMNADADVTHEGNSIRSASVEYLLEALEQLLPENHDPQDHTLPRLLLLIAEIRTLIPYHEELLKHYHEDADGLSLPNAYIEYLTAKRDTHCTGVRTQQYAVVYQSSAFRKKVTSLEAQ